MPPDPVAPPRLARDPPEPMTPRDTAAPATPLPATSLTVTVIVALSPGSMAVALDATETTKVPTAGRTVMVFITESPTYPVFVATAVRAMLDVPPTVGAEMVSDTDPVASVAPEVISAPPIHSRTETPPIAAPFWSTVLTRTVTSSPETEEMGTMDTSAVSSPSVGECRFM